MMFISSGMKLTKNKIYSSLFGPTPIPANTWPVVSTMKSIATSSMSSAMVIFVAMFLIKDQLMGCEDYE